MICPMPYRDRTLTSFGRNVARIRGERGFSQDKLADLDRTYEHDQLWEVWRNTEVGVNFLLRFNMESV